MNTAAKAEVMKEPTTPRRGRACVLKRSGGRCYFPTHKGFITLQVMPAGTR